MPPPLSAVLLVTLLSVSVRLPTLKMPPPGAAPALPLVMVTPESTSVAKLCTWNTRSIPPPLMVVKAAPAPVIVTLLKTVMSRSPVAAASSPAPAMVSVKVPAGSAIVSSPGSAFASWMAARSVQMLTNPRGVVDASQTPSPGLMSP